MILIKDNKILVCKNNDNIIISVDGKKLIISNKDVLFNQLISLTKDKIREWYLNRK